MTDPLHTYFLDVLEKRYMNSYPHDQRQCAIVDLLGFQYENIDGEMVKVTLQSPLHLRYEIRSRAHTEVYKFPVVRKNNYWKTKEAGEA